jgi:hypothetical protein
VICQDPDQSEKDASQHFDITKCHSKIKKKKKGSNKLIDKSRKYCMVGALLLRRGDLDEATVLKQTPFHHCPDSCLIGRSTERQGSQPQYKYWAEEVSGRASFPNNTSVFGDPID